MIQNLFGAISALAAACCAGSGATPSIISGDDVAQLSISVARGSVIGDAPAQGIPIFRNGDYSEITQTSLFSGAFLLSDLWQAGVSVPFVSHNVGADSGSNSSSTGVGDIRLNLAHEFLPEWSYSAWKPRGFVFLQLTLPTGTSVYDSQEAGAVDALGKGFYSVGVGSLLTKRLSSWDVYSIPEIHFSLARSFQSELAGLGQVTGPIQVGSGWGGSFSLGVGVSPGAGDFRVGVRLQPLYETSKSVFAEAVESQTSYQLSWNTALEATYLLSTAWVINATYTDQTLLGPVANTTLSRTLALGLQHRWER